MTGPGSDRLPDRVCADHRVPYEERFPRYSHNAGVTAAYAERDAARLQRASGMHGSASDNAFDHDDEDAADWYEDMEHYARDAAEALKKMAACARLLEVHYRDRSMQVAAGFSPFGRGDARTRGITEDDVRFLGSEQRGQGEPPPDPQDHGC